MTMQHKRGTFDGTDLTGFVSVPRTNGGEVQVRKAAMSKRATAVDALALRIDHLNMASRGAVERISHDEKRVPHWFCLRVMTGAEFAVENLLEKSDVESLVVRTNSVKRVVRKRVRIIQPRPVIAGYVLVHCHPIPAAMMGLLRVDHVLDVVGGPLSPWRADGESIDRFKKMADEGKYDHRVIAKHSFELGEEVRVADGPFASFIAVVTAIDNEGGRVTLDIEIFGRLTPVELDIAQIEKV